MSEFKSKLVNSYIVPRGDEQIFYLLPNGGGILCSLNGYVIMPVEQFNALVPEDERVPVERHMEDDNEKM